MHFSPFFLSYPSVTPAVWRKLAFILLFFAFISILISGYLVWQRYYNPNRLAFTSNPNTVQNSKFPLFPIRVTIPNLGIDLPIVASEIKNGVWQTTSVGVSYLLTSSRPGEAGNSIYYGHNWPRLLGKLRNIQIGQKIYIYSSSGKIITYVVNKISRVSPAKIEIFTPSLPYQLTIYTCIGLADSQRLVVTAYMQDEK